MNRRGPVALVLAMVAFPPLAGQAPPRYELQRINGATFTEQVRTDVTSESGVAAQVRRIARIARFGVATRGDTLIVTADSLDLRETANGVEHVIDVDPLIGGRWILMLDPRGHAVVSAEPFVPLDVADVSDLSIAMNDFFPPAPPALTAGQPVVDQAVRNWRRLTDSAGLSRYRWSMTHHTDSSYVAVDSLPVRAIIDTREEGEMAWHVTRGPIAWSRQVETTATSHFAGRTSRAAITQHVVVRRTP